MKADIFLRLGSDQEDSGNTVLDIVLDDEPDRHYQIECGREAPVDLTVEKARRIAQPLHPAGGRFFLPFSQVSKGAVRRDTSMTDGEQDMANRYCIEVAKEVPASRGAAGEFFLHSGPFQGTYRFHDEGVSVVPKECRSAVLQGDVVPPLGTAGLPETLQKQCPAIYRYWETADPGEALRRLDALRKSNTLQDLVFTPEGPIRAGIEIESYYRWEPEEAPSEEELVKSILPAGRRVVSPFAEDSWAAEVAKADADDSVVFVDHDDPLVLEEVAESLQKSAADYVVTAPRRPEFVSVLRTLGEPRVFDAHPDRVFVASQDRWLLGQHPSLPAQAEKAEEPEACQKAFADQVNMDLAELKKWKRTKASRQASCRDLLLTCQDVLSAEQWDQDVLLKAQDVTSMIARLSRMPQCAERDEALKNCGHDPQKVRQQKADESDRFILKQLTRASKIVTKEEGDERFIYGVVAEPGTVDAHGDTLSKETIRVACHNYMHDYQAIHLQHQADITGMVKILECFIAPVDFSLGGELVLEGSWIMGARVNDDVVWQACKNGTLTGWSLGGWAVREPVT